MGWSWAGGLTRGGACDGQNAINVDLSFESLMYECRRLNATRKPHRLEKDVAGPGKDKKDKKDCVIS